jgi:hypothetical protein
MDLGDVFGIANAESVAIAVDCQITSRVDIENGPVVVYSSVVVIGKFQLAAIWTVRVGAARLETGRHIEDHEAVVVCVDVEEGVLKIWIRVHARLGDEVRALFSPCADHDLIMCTDIQGEQVSIDIAAASSFY